VTRGEQRGEAATKSKAFGRSILAQKPFAAIPIVRWAGSKRSTSLLSIATVRTNIALPDCIRSKETNPDGAHSGTKYEQNGAFRRSGQISLL